MPHHKISAGTYARWSGAFARHALRLEAIFLVLGFASFLLTLTKGLDATFSIYPENFGAGILLIALPATVVTLVITLADLHAYRNTSLHPVWTLCMSIFMLAGYVVTLLFYLSFVPFRAMTSMNGYVVEAYDQSPDPQFRYTLVNAAVLEWTIFAMQCIMASLYFSYMCVSAVAVHKWRGMKKNKSAKWQAADGFCELEVGRIDQQNGTPTEERRGSADVSIVTVSDSLVKC